MLQNSNQNAISCKDILSVTLNSIGDAVICTDVNAKINFINPVAEKLIGYNAAEAIGKHIDECFVIVNGITREKVENPILEVLKTGIVVGLANHTILISKSGVEYHISDSGAPIIDEFGNLLGVVLVFRDVSEQYEAEIKLIESEENFRRLFENMKEGVALHDLVFNDDGIPINYLLVKTNPLYESHTGIKLMEGQTKLATDIYNTDSPPYLEEFASVAISGETMVFDTFFPPLNRYFHISVVQTRKNSFATIFEDITERVKITEALKESENRFRKIFEDSSDAIMILKNGRIYDCNLACIKLFKYSSKTEIIGKTPDILSPPFQADNDESRKKAIALMELAYTKGNNRFEWVHLCSDKSLIECEVVLTSMRHKDDKLLHAVIRDITSQKYALRKLVESEEKFRNLHETMTQGVMYFDSNFKLISANNSSTEIFKIDSNDTQLVMKDFIFSDINGSLLKFEDQPLYKALTFGEKVIDFKFGIYHPKWQQTKWLNASAYPIFDVFDKKPSKAYVIVSDITELIEISKALKIEKEKAEQSDNLKTAFLANMSHEIRTPMNAIVGFSQLLQTTSISNEDRLYYTEIINNSAKNLLRIIDDLLDLSKIEAGQMTLQLAPVNINNLLEKTNLIFQQSLKSRNKNKVILIYHELNELVVIKADETRLQQILNNLIENSIKFTNEGSIEFGMNIIGEKLQFYVKDTGIGMSPSVHNRVFERFWRDDISANTSIKGTGLGLSICKKLSNLMGGDISFTSDLNKGSCFFLEIPFVDSNQNVANNLQIKQTSSIEKKIKILAVEDDPINILYLKELLKRCSNCNAEFVADGFAALDAVKQKNFDIILLDIQLPGINGYEVAKQIRQTNKEVIIIAQTAYAMPEDKIKCISAGCNNYISKPININELFEMINKYSK